MAGVGILVAARPHQAPACGSRHHFDEEKNFNESERKIPLGTSLVVNYVLSVFSPTLLYEPLRLVPAVLIVILASERLLHLKDSVISQLVILTASNDVLSSATKFASSIRGLDQIALLLLYVLVLDTIRNLAPRRRTSLA